MESKMRNKNEANEKILKSILEDMLEVETDDFRISSLERQEIEEQNRKMECGKTQEEREKYKNEGMAIKQREIILKLYTKGYTMKQISGMLDLSEKKVKRIVERFRVNRNT